MGEVTFNLKGNREATNAKTPEKKLKHNSTEKRVRLNFRGKRTERTTGLF